MGKHKRHQKHKAKASHLSLSQPEADGCSDIPADHVPGTVPNLYWNAISPSALNQHPRYVCLPQLELEADGISDSRVLRFIRQGTKAWDQAHPGVLSTGILPDALGFREEKVARKVGCAQLAGHGRLVHAAQHLRLQPLRCMTQPSTAACQQATDSGREVPTLTCQPHSLQDGASAQCSSSGMSCQQALCELITANAQQQQDATDGQDKQSDTVASMPGPQQMPPAAWDKTDVQLMLECIQVARQGLMKVRQVWGHIQEGSALYGLMQIMPRAVLHEVGMCVLHHHQLPKHWSIPAGCLPPLAASPDALIAHPVLCLPQATPQLGTDSAREAREVRGSSCAARGPSLSLLRSLITSCHDGNLPNPCPACQSQLISPQSGTAPSQSMSGEPDNNVRSGEAGNEGQESQQGGGHVCWACGAAGGRSRVLRAKPLEGRIDPPQLHKLKQVCRQQVMSLVQQHVEVQVPVKVTAAELDPSHAGHGSDGEGDGCDQEQEQGSITDEAGSDEDDAATGADADSNAPAVVDLLCQDLQDRCTVGTAPGLSADQAREAYAAVQDQLQLGQQSLNILTGMNPLLVLPNPKPSNEPTAAVGVATQNTYNPAQACPEDPSQGSPSQASSSQASSSQASSSQASSSQALLNVQGTTSASSLFGHVELGAYVEVVEVKSTVPFKQVARKTGARGRIKVELRVVDSGPRSQVAAHWLPQLQLHMLATGCWSALLVSRSVTKGIKVFRVFRDDEYCYRMIQLVSRLYSSFVLTGRSPPVNALCGEPGYQSLLDHSIRLARNAVCVAHWPGPSPVPPGTDTRPFV